MEDWEKRFQALEKEVDEQFEKSERQNRPRKENQESIIDSIKEEATKTVVKKAAEESLARVGTKRLVLYGVGVILLGLLILANIWKIAFIGLVMGGLWYALEGRNDPEEDEELEEEDS